MKIRTLIVDDEPLAREKLAELLAAEPEIEIAGECGDGLQAVAAIQSLRPDLILLDGTQLTLSRGYWEKLQQLLGEEL